MERLDSIKGQQSNMSLKRLSFWRQEAALEKYLTGKSGFCL